MSEQICGHIWGKPPCGGTAQANFAAGVVLAADGIAHLVEELPGVFPRVLILGLILER